MELKKCNRCGGFYATESNVCPKCTEKDNLELSTFKNYIELNGVSSADEMSVGTGISSRNINRFLDIEGLKCAEANEDTIGNNGITLN